MQILTFHEIQDSIRLLLKKYHAESAWLFGSYARGDATASSDIDVLVIGGENFKPGNIFAFGEDLRELTGHEVDAFEIREITPETPIHRSIMKEGIRIT